MTDDLEEVSDEVPEVIPQPDCEPDDGADWAIIEEFEGIHTVVDRFATEEEATAAVEGGGYGETAVVENSPEPDEGLPQWLSEAALELATYGFEVVKLKKRGAWWVDKNGNAINDIGAINFEEDHVVEVYSIEDTAS